MISENLNGLSDLYFNDINKFHGKKFRKKFLNNYESEMVEFLKYHIQYNKLRINFVKNDLLTILDIDKGFKVYFNYNIKDRIYKISIFLKNKFESNFFFNFINNIFTKQKFVLDGNFIIVNSFYIDNLLESQFKFKLRSIIKLINEINSYYNTNYYFSLKTFGSLLNIFNEISEGYLNQPSKFSNQNYKNSVLNRFKHNLLIYLNKSFSFNDVYVTLDNDSALLKASLKNNFQINFDYNPINKIFNIYISVKDESNFKFLVEYVKSSLNMVYLNNLDNKLYIDKLSVSDLNYDDFKNKLDDNIEIIKKIYQEFISVNYVSLRRFWRFFNILNSFSESYLVNPDVFLSEGEELLNKYKNCLLGCLNKSELEGNIELMFNEDFLSSIVCFDDSFHVFFDYDLVNKFFKISISVINLDEFKFFVNYVKNLRDGFDFEVVDDKLVIGDYNVFESSYLDFKKEFNKNLNVINDIYDDYLKDVSKAITFDDNINIWKLGYDESEINDVCYDFKFYGYMKYDFNGISNEFNPINIKNRYSVRSKLPQTFFNDMNYIKNFEKYFSIKPNDLILIGSKTKLCLIGIVVDNAVKSEDNQNFFYAVNWIYDVPFDLSNIQFKDNNIDKMKVSLWNSILIKMANNNLDIKKKVLNVIFDTFNEDYDEVTSKYNNFDEFISFDDFSLINNNSFNLENYRFPTYHKYFEKFYNYIKDDDDHIRESLVFSIDLMKINSNSYCNIIKNIFNNSYILSKYNKNFDNLPDGYIDCIYNAYMSLINNHKLVQNNFIINSYKKCVNKKWNSQFGHKNVLLALLLFYEGFLKNTILKNILLFFDYPRTYFNYDRFEDYLNELNLDLYEKVDFTNFENFIKFALWMSDDSFNNYLNKEPPLISYEVLIEENNKSKIINLTIMLLNDYLNDFIVSETIINKLCSAFNAGKNIILKGSCGTGKTDLILRFSKAALENNFIDGYILTTATSDWSTFDTIGGLVPDDNGTLIFNQGKVLESIASNKWLIIDEINRADIDKAFGQLFTVLSGHNVELPYGENGKPISIKLWDKIFSKHDEKNATYYIGKNWRIIGTMNIDDKDSLFDLSYAFMRRFMFIDVDLPEEYEYKNLIRFWAKDLDEFYLNKLLQLYDIVKFRSIGPAIFKDIIEYLSVRSYYGSSDKNKILSESINAYIVPQLEGLTEKDINKIKSFLHSIDLLEYLEEKLDNLILDI